jgi:hypothetical protein
MHFLSVFLSKNQSRLTLQGYFFLTDYALGNPCPLPPGLGRKDMTSKTNPLTKIDPTPSSSPL